MYLNSYDNQNCSTCIKNDVCKYKEERSNFTIPSTPNFLEVKISCKYYYGNYTISNSTSRNFDTISISNSTSASKTNF